MRQKDSGETPARGSALSTWSDADLVAALKRRNSAAFEHAVTRYSSQMLAAARAIVGTAQAEDVVQDAWMTVVNKIGTFEGRSSLGTWLQRIAVNGAISWLRATSREVQLHADDGSDPVDAWFNESGGWLQGPVAWDTGSPEALLSADALQECIEKHLRLMSANQRSVVVMRDIEGLEFDEICNALELSASNVRVLLHRGRLRLMGMIDGFQEHGSC